MGAFFACNVYADVSLLVRRVLTVNREHLKGVSVIFLIWSVLACVHVSYSLGGEEESGRNSGRVCPNSLKFACRWNFLQIAQR